MTNTTTHPPIRLSLPGFGRPLNDYPNRILERLGIQDSGRLRFPNAIEDSYHCYATPVSLRERRMMDFINQISDKPEWYHKVFDESIVARWRSEAVVFNEHLREEYLTAPMFDFCIQELRDKAESHQASKLISVLDCQVAVVKSDEIVPDSLQHALQQAVRVLEDVPDHLKDWHPGSDGKVLDLLHPSLFPLIHGVSRALPYGTVPMGHCSRFSGDGEVVHPVFTGRLQNMKDHRPSDRSLKPWGSFQWLPSDVRFASDGKATITSYVNNLHPKKHQDLYHVLEQFVDAAIPLWNECLSWSKERLRLEPVNGMDEDFMAPDHIQYVPEPGEAAPPTSRDSEPRPNPRHGTQRGRPPSGWTARYRQWFHEHRVLKPTFLRPFQTRQDRVALNHIMVDLKRTFVDSGLQVIFKLANINLTPDKPAYEGGTWHVEGALNEHICATALFYYDEHNITPSHLAFRQSLDADQIDGPAIQRLGSVLTRPGRLLAFPNTLQHRVEPFRLVDPSKPGHRKILAMFLVDPYIRILSTANVPPQRADWWAEEVRRVPPFKRLPEEIFRMVINHVHGFPLTWEEAVATRQSLMAERGAMVDMINEEMDEEVFSFCEH